MAETTVASELVVTNYLDEFFKEWIRSNQFSRYTGTGMNNIINIKEGRQAIEIPLVTRLQGEGVTGSQLLRGNGEKVNNYGMTLTPTYHRHAVEFDKEELEKPNIELMTAARPLLMDWSMNLVRDQVIKAFSAMHTGSAYVEIAAASEANADAYLVNNDDRILFGAAKANGGGTDHSGGISACDTTNDTLSSGIVSLAKRMAKTADPHIKPFRDDEGGEWYVMFADTYAFRDLKTSLGTAHQNAGPRSQKNPIFRDGDLVWDGVIIREVPEIDTLVTATDGTLSTLNLLTGGASSARVAPSFLCGQQAVGFGLGQRPDIIVDKTYDYGFRPGVAIECKHDIDKSFFNSVQHGMVTVYCAAAIDA